MTDEGAEPTAGPTTDWADRYRVYVRARLRPGEDPRRICVATGRTAHEAAAGVQRLASWVRAQATEVTHERVWSSVRVEVVGVIPLAALRHEVED